MITDRNIDPGASIGIDKMAFPYIISGKHTDGSLPKIVWVSKGGADSLSSAQGSRNEPFLTINGVSGAMRQTVDGRGDRIIVGPGIWRENLDFGSGTGTTGSAGRMNKRDIGLYGSGGAHPGRTQIVSDGATTGPTIRVRDGYARGFVLADLEVGNVDSADADRVQPLIDIETNDTATLTADSSDEWTLLRNLRLDGGGSGSAGLVLTGATMFRAYHLEIANCTLGLVLRGSLSNSPENLMFWDTVFHDNITADITTVTGNEGQWVFVAGGDTSLTNVRFVRNLYMDRGGTPVTNYVNVVGTMVNVVDFEFVAARDVADGTLMQLPVDWVAIGRSAAAAEFIIGA